MNRSTTTNLRIGFGLSLILLLISSVASYISIDGLSSSIKLARQTNLTIRKLENVTNLLVNAETGQRGFLLSGSESFLEPYNGAYEKAIAEIAELKELTRASAAQQQSANDLYKVATTRLRILDELIQKKRSGQQVNVIDLERGKRYMDEVRRIVKEMQDRETTILAVRTGSVDSFTKLIPWVIIFTSLLSVGITLYFYFKLKNDYEARTKLQNELLKKDEDIHNRIETIRNYAENIAAGKYDTFMDQNDTEDGLGSIAVHMNNMSRSLQSTFTALSDRDWIKTGQNELTQLLAGEKDVKELSGSVLDFLAKYANVQAGALYANDSKNSMLLLDTYAIDKAELEKKLKDNDSLAGQVLKSKSEILINIPEQVTAKIKLTSGEIVPRTVIALPVLFEKEVLAVIEMASLVELDEKTLELLRSVSHPFGIAINSALNRSKLQELLEETQAQAEELQTQHAEMENLNSELESHTQKLQASEEELRVQQEELLQINQEIEEKARLLEERNQIITERNLEIKAKAEQLELSTRYKSEFLANMSHELRTPLNSILLLSRLLSENHDKNLTDEQTESARVIQNSGTGLLSLIDEILDLSKIEAGKMILEYEKTSVKAIFDELNGIFNPLAKDKGLEFTIEKHPDVAGTIETDKMRLGQILKNLLSNAIKFTSEGSVKLKVAPAVNDQYLEFAVTDTGIGIARDKQATIFEAFQQADGSTRRKYGGTGLGLSISKELAKLLNGDINVISDPGKGSTFTLLLPVAKKSAAQTIPYKEIQAPKIEEQKESPSKFVVSELPESVEDDRSNIVSGDRCILIIEDDVNFAKALVKFTHDQGYKAIVTVRGDEGIELARQYKPLAILLDIQLPIKDGWQVMDELKSDNSTRHIPVHIMSSLQARKESLQKGAIDFINKPVALEQMQTMFKKLEDALNRDPKKVLIVEENTKHAQALSYFLGNFNVNSQITTELNDSVSALKRDEVDCVILDMGMPDAKAYDMLEMVKKNPGLENLPIIIFTGKSLSKSEETRIKQYADSIVVKTAHSYQRILDEVALFLHLVDEEKKEKTQEKATLGDLRDVLKEKKVLVVDDDVRNIFSLTKSLEQHNMNVISAIDGKEALKQLEDHPDVDIVLMDMMMPEMDGYETTSIIRKNKKYKNLPVLAVTAKAMLGDREKCIKAGASDYISKPVDLDQLVSLLRVWLYDKNF